MGIESYHLGLLGEDEASEYLLRKGYKIVGRNFRSSQGEIDIIAYNGETLVFIEVKSYSGRSYLTPLGAILKNKKNSIIHAAKYYLYKNKIKNVNCRFDVLAIYRYFNETSEIELIKGAFDAC
jgi:putative endonuclease